MDILFQVLNSIPKKPISSKLMDIAMGLTDIFDEPVDVPSPFSNCPSLYPNDDLSWFQIYAVIFQWLFLLLFYTSPLSPRMHGCLSPVFCLP